LDAELFGNVLSILLDPEIIPFPPIDLIIILMKISTAHSHHPLAIVS
jgi:hypothetical protein